jgi:hypothetical protein
MPAPRHILLFAALALGTLLTGCATGNSTAGNTIPWDRSGSTYDIGVPGMNNFTGNSGAPTGGNGLR